MPSFRDLQKKTSTKASPKKLIAKPTAPKTTPLPDETTLLKQLGIAPSLPPRRLGETAPDIPYTFRSENDSQQSALMKTVLLAEETHLGIWIQPSCETVECAWIAVSVPEQDQLILLHRLPLLATFNPSEYDPESPSPSTKTPNAPSNSSPESSPPTTDA